MYMMRPFLLNNVAAKKRHTHYHKVGKKSSAHKIVAMLCDVHWKKGIRHLPWFQKPNQFLCMFDLVECHFVYFLSFQDRAQKRQREEMTQVAVPPSFSLIWSPFPIRLCRPSHYPRSPNNEKRCFLTFEFASHFPILCRLTRLDDIQQINANERRKELGREQHARSAGGWRGYSLYVRSYVELVRSA